MQRKLPFGKQSAAPGLQNVPKLRLVAEKDELPNFLRLSKSSQEAMALHVEKVGLDRSRFGYSVKEQGISVFVFNYYSLFSLQNRSGP